MILFDEKYLRIEVDKNQDLMVQTWKGNVSSEEYREGVLKVLEIFREQKVSKVISDTKEQANVKKEDVDFEEKLVPEFIKSGMKCYAFVIPTNSFAKLSVERFKKESESKLPLQYFDDVEKAREWLRRK
jgi:hypothetical protein